MLSRTPAHDNSNNEISQGDGKKQAEMIEKQSGNEIKRSQRGSNS